MVFFKIKGKILMNFVYRSYIGHFCIWHQNSGHFTKFCHSWQNFGLYCMRRVANFDHLLGAILYRVIKTYENVRGPHFLCRGVSKCIFCNRGIKNAIFGIGGLENAFLVYWRSYNYQFLVLGVSKMQFFGMVGGPANSQKSTPSPLT
jgi:hypothetical protein